MKGKDLAEVIASGREKLSSVPCGGGVAVAVSAAPGGGGGGAAPAAAESKKEEKVEEKEESDDVSVLVHFNVKMFLTLLLAYFNDFMLCDGNSFELVVG